MVRLAVRVTNPGFRDAFHAGWTDVADDVLLAEDQARRFPE
jgi:hypothetical protein